MLKITTTIAAILLLVLSGLLVVTLNIETIPSDMASSDSDSPVFELENDNAPGEGNYENREDAANNTIMTNENTVEISGINYELFIDPKIEKHVTDFGGSSWFVNTHRSKIESELAKNADDIVLVTELGASDVVPFTLDTAGSFVHTYTLVLKKSEARAGLFVNNPRGLLDLETLLVKYDENNVDQNGGRLIYEIDSRKFFVNQDAILAYAESTPDQELVNLLVPPVLSKLIFYVDPSIFIGDGKMYGVVGDVTYVERDGGVYITITKDFFDENMD